MKISELRENLWSGVPRYNEDDVEHIRVDELWSKLSSSDKVTINNFMPEDRAYLDNLKNAIEKDGIRQPLITKHEGDGRIHVPEGLHRLVVARELNLDTVPIRWER